MGMDGGGVMPVYNMNDRGYDDSYGGGNWMWVMMLFFLLAWGGNGFGGNEQAATKSDLCEGFNFNNIENGVRGIQNGLCDGFYAQNTTMLNGFAGITAAVKDAQFASQQCCCEINRNIDAVRYEAQKNTCDITNAIHAEGEATRALITQNEVQKLRDELQAAQLQLGNVAQTQTLVNELRPCSKPAYITCSPYQAFNYGGGCGGVC